MMIHNDNFFNDVFCFNASETHLAPSTPTWFFAVVFFWYKKKNSLFFFFWRKLANPNLIQWELYWPSMPQIMISPSHHWLLDSLGVNCWALKFMKRKSVLLWRTQCVDYKLSIIVLDLANESFERFFKIWDSEHYLINSFFFFVWLAVAEELLATFNFKSVLEDKAKRQPNSFSNKKEKVLFLW